MFAPTVVEAHIELEPVTSDPFIADLDGPSYDTQARLAAFAERGATAPSRRVYD